MGADFAAYKKAYLLQEEADLHKAQEHWDQEDPDLALDDYMRKRERCGSEMKRALVLTDISNS